MKIMGFKVKVVLKYEIWGFTLPQSFLHPDKDCSVFLLCHPGFLLICLSGNRNGQ